MSLLKQCFAPTPGTDSNPDCLRGARHQPGSSVLQESKPASPELDGAAGGGRPCLLSGQAQRVSPGPAGLPQQAGVRGNWRPENDARRGFRGVGLDFLIGFGIG